jgi:hypothetical protein
MTVMAPPEDVSFFDLAIALSGGAIALSYVASQLSKRTQSMTLSSGDRPFNPWIT